MSKIWKIFSNPYTLSVLGVFFIALLVRVISLDNIPVGFHEDEAHIGYNAYSLVMTLHDKNGQFLPLAIDQFGDFRPAGYHYFAALPIWLFGLTEFSTRIISSIFGALSVIAIYFLAKEIFNKKITSLAASIFLAVLPWHIVVSRATSEGVIALFFILTGSYFILKAFRKKEKLQYYLLLGHGSLIISLFFYHAARFFIPLLLLTLYGVILLKYKTSLQEKVRTSAHGLFVGLSLLVIMLFSSGADRPAMVSIFNHPETALVLNEEIRQDDQQHPLITRFFHNKIYAYSDTFTQNYFKHFTGEFLLTDGGLPARYSIPSSGNMYLILGLFLFLGISYMVVRLIQQKQYMLVLPLLWLLLGPIPSALTWEDVPNVQRSSMMIPALVLISAYGFTVIFDLLKSSPKRKLFTLFCAGILTFSTVSFLHTYFFHSDTLLPNVRGDGIKELVLATTKYTDNNQTVVMTKDNMNRDIYYLFYLKQDPGEYQNLNKKLDIRGEVYKNYIFTDTSCPILDPTSENTVYVMNGDCTLPDNAEILEEFTWNNIATVFTIVRAKPGNTQ